jgi:hypothetical protein
MQLKLTRSQREGGVVSKSVIFCLDARIQLTPEEQANVNRYKLGGQVIYNSEASKRHLAKSEAAQGTGTAGGIAKSFVSLAMAALNLNITINGLQRGQHIECKSLDELLGAEEALMEACQNLRAYLDTAASFDGREVLVDFSGKEPAVVSTAPPPMLAAPSPQTASPPPVYEAAQAASGAAPGTAPAPPYQSPPDYSPGGSPFDDILAQARRFWFSATRNQKILIIVGGIVVLILLLRSCS